MSSSNTTRNTGPDAFRRTRRFARECALRVLYQRDVQERWQPEEDDFGHFWEQLASLQDMPPDCSERQARRFAAATVAGVVANHNEIDAQLTACADNWRIDRMCVIDRNILRLAAYEMLFCEAIPPVVSLDEAVELAKEFGDKDSWRFVNGVLDRLMRDTSK